MALGTQIYVYDPETGEMSELTADVGAGFGDAANKYAWSGYMYDGNGDGVDELYVGTWNVQPDVPGTLNAVLRAEATGGASLLLEGASMEDYAAPLKSDGGEVWQYDFTTETWTVVLDSSHEGLDDGDTGFREIKEYNGKLYASTATPANLSDNTTTIFVSEDGVTWTELEGGPLDPETGNNSIRTMSVVEDPEGNEVLIMGTSNYEADAEIWTYSDDGTWTYVASMEADTISDFFVDENGDIYVTTWSDYEMHKVDLSQAGTDGALTDVTPDYSETAGPETELGIIEITYFEGYYYVGSANYSGTSLIRTQTLNDPDSWEVITTDGFQTYGDDQATPALAEEFAELGVETVGYTWQMYELDGYLYVGTFTSGTLVMLRSDNGTDWEVVDVDFAEEDYGIRTMIPVALDENGMPTDGDPNVMIIGTASPFYDMVPPEELLSYPGGLHVGTDDGGMETGTSDEDVILGFAGDDTMVGGAEDDVMAGDASLPGAAGADLMHGNDGDDMILGNGGADELYGDAGQDTVVGGTGADLIYGGGDNDLLIGDAFLDDQIVEILDLLGLTGPFSGGTADLQALAQDSAGDTTGAGNDLIYGGAGADTALAGGGADYYWGGAGSDVGYGGTGVDRLWGGADEDYLFGEEGRDRLFGEDGDDMLDGGTENDLLSGGAGHDSLYGGDGLDRLVGGDGQDFLQGGAGNDRMTGGAGADVFSLSDDAIEEANLEAEEILQIVTGDDIIFDFQDGTDVIDLGAIEVDPETFAEDLAAATTKRGVFSTQIDLDALGGEGAVTLIGVSVDQVDVMDFTGDYLLA